MEVYPIAPQVVISGDYSTKKAMLHNLCLADPISSQTTIGNMPAEWVDDGYSPSNPDQDMESPGDEFTRLPRGESRTAKSL